MYSAGTIAMNLIKVQSDSIRMTVVAGDISNEFRYFDPCIKMDLKEKDKKSFIAIQMGVNVLDVCFWHILERWHK